jgi:hypothetical protein
MPVQADAKRKIDPARRDARPCGDGFFILISEVD